MFLVYAGALGDLEMWDKAIEVVHTVGRSQGLPGEYRMRAVQAEQYFLEEAGRSKEAEQLNDLLDRLEDQYADEEIDENSDDVVIDHDLEDITDDSDVLEKLGIDPDEAQYAPDPEQEYGDEDDEAEDGDAESDEADETEQRLALPARGGRPAQGLRLGRGAVAGHHLFGGGRPYGGQGVARRRARTGIGRRAFAR